MALSLSSMRGALHRAVMAADQPDDGLNEYAVFGDRDYPNYYHRITKIEPFDSTKVYARNCLGVVRAKDELDAWRSACAYIEDYTYYDSSRREGEG